MIQAPECLEVGLKLDNVGLAFTITAAANNFVTLPKLLVGPP
jgi:hypothetical protein